jgi:hypothetical protein
MQQYFINFSIISLHPQQNANTFTVDGQLVRRSNRLFLPENIRKASPIDPVPPSYPHRNRHCDGVYYHVQQKKSAFFPQPKANNIASGTKLNKQDNQGRQYIAACNAQRQKRLTLKQN